MMGFQIGEEDIFPFLALAGSGLDGTKVDIIGLQALKRLYQRTGFVFDGEYQGSTVTPGGGAGLVADDKESGGI